MDSGKKMEKQDLCVKPIGIFHTAARYPYDVPRQGSVAEDNAGVVRLYPEYTEGLSDLAGFSHIWLVYWFHLNGDWHLKVRPPRHVDRKVGVFASRSPYRPNPLGMSAVRVVDVCSNEIWISGHDLLDGTPILDVKPYLPYADSFPDASPGWTAENCGRECDVVFSEKSALQLTWLESHGVNCLRQFAMTQLGYEPTNGSRHRLTHLPDGGTALAYRTWRLRFSVEEQLVTVQEIFSGYSQTELSSTEDRYGDKELHREYASMIFR